MLSTKVVLFASLLSSISIAGSPPAAGCQVTGVQGEYLESEMQPGVLVSLPFFQRKGSHLLKVSVALGYFQL